MWVWLGLLLTLSTTSMGAEILVFESALDTQSEMSRGIIDAYKVLLDKQGIVFVPREYPSRRGLQELKSGRVDGTLARAGDLVRVFGMKDLVRIDFPVFTLSGYMWCRPDAHKAKPLVLGYKMGNILATKLIRAVDTKRIKVAAITSYRSSVEMLNSGRLTCILANPEVIKSDGLNPDDLKDFDQKELITSRAYSWIDKRFERLKPILESGLNSYPFPKGYREKFNSDKPACQGEFDVLCPDGVVYKEVIDFRKELSRNDDGNSL